MQHTQRPSFVQMLLYRLMPHFRDGRPQHLSFAYFLQNMVLLPICMQSWVYQMLPANDHPVSEQSQVIIHRFVYGLLGGLFNLLKPFRKTQYCLYHL